MKFLYLSFFILFISSCKPSHTFDKKKWAEHKDLINYPNRKDMLDDLLKNYELKGKSYSQILDLLGQPVMTPLKIDTISELLYGIEMDFGKDKTLKHVKTLSLKFNSDTIVQDYKIIEWSK